MSSSDDVYLLQYLGRRGGLPRIPEECMSPVTRLVLALCLFASVAFAAPEAPAKPVSPLDTVETLQGRLKVQSDGRLFVVTIEKPEGGGFRRFDVELESGAGTAFDFRAEAGDIHYWRGHLVVVAPRERKAFHFSMKDLVRPARMMDAPFASASDAAELDAMLRSKHELTRSDRAVAISSLGGPRALEAGGELRSRIAPADIGDQNPEGRDGLDTCGASCSITCGDGSNCSTSCTGTRCASCSCLATCSCS